MQRIARSLRAVTCVRSGCPAHQTHRPTAIARSVSAATLVQALQRQSELFAGEEARIPIGRGAADKLNAEKTFDEKIADLDAATTATAAAMDALTGPAKPRGGMSAVTEAAKAAGFDVVDMTVKAVGKPN